MFFYASAYMREGDYPRARRIFYEALANAYNDFQIYINLGLMDFMTGRWPEAVANFNTALTISPKSAIAYTNLGAVYLRMNDLSSAEQSYLKAVSDSNVFTKALDIKNMAGKIKTARDAVTIALDFEKDSILFFIQMKKFTRPEWGQAEIDKLIEQEQEHIVTLTALLKELS